MKRFHKSARGVTALLALVLTACVGGQARGADGESDGDKPAKKPPTVSEVFKTVKDSVVEIHTIERQIVETHAGRPMTSVGGLGSGVLVRVPVETKDGKTEQAIRVLPAAHVVQTADRVAIMLADGRDISARVISSAPYADVALLALDAEPGDVVVATIGDSSKVETGDRILIVGNPYGLTHTLTVGHVSARRKTDQMVGELEPLELIQTDAAVNTGNSGGPMFNMKGEIVGIVSYILSRSGGFEGTGFAVSSNLAKKLVLEGKAVWTGVDGIYVGGDVAEALNLPQETGILVQRVANGSPAQRAGIRGGHISAEIKEQKVMLGGDVILAVEGSEISLEGDALKRIGERLDAAKPGERLKLKVLRAGKVIELPFVVEIR